MYHLSGYLCHDCMALLRKNFFLMSDLNFLKFNVQAEFLQLVAIVPCGISCDYQEESGCTISGAALQAVAGGC